MFKAVAITVLTLSMAASVTAQTLHGYPGKAAYASSAEWPFVSGQCHWAPSENPVMDPPMLGHTHIELLAPIYSETDGSPFTMSFTLKLFHTSGRITNFWGDMVESVVWDATGTSTPPVMIGDPHGVSAWTGHVTIAPLRRIQAAKDNIAPALAKHGWFTVPLNTRTELDNGDRMDAQVLFPVWSNIDPTAPILNQIQLHGPSAGTVCQGGSARDLALRPSVGQPNIFGGQISQIDSMLPIIGPLTGPWAVDSFTYGYQTFPEIPFGVYELRRDLDLHNGIPGILLSTGTGVTSQQTDILSPELFGKGVHKLAFMWNETTGEGVPGILTAHELEAALFVVNVTVDNDVSVIVPVVPPPTPPVVTPPPPTKACSGTVTGTSKDSVTVTVTSGTIVCQ